MSADVFRSLSLFITYAIRQSKPAVRLRKMKSIRFRARSDLLAPINENTGSYVSSLGLALEMLRMYCSFLCNKHDCTPLKKFARAVTNKV